MKNRVGKVMMNAVDRAWLEMDEPGNPMVIGAVMQLDGPVDAGEFQKELVERLMRHPRFRQRVERAHGAACWVPDENLDYGYHVQVRRLAAAGYDRNLRKAISEATSRDLDDKRPLWRLTLFPRPGGPITLLFRVHHAVADGIALVTLLMDSTDSGQLRATGRSIATEERQPHPGPLGVLIDKLETLNHGLERIGGFADAMKNRSVLLRAMRQGWASVGAVRRLLRLPDENPECLRKPLGGRRGVTWVDSIAFAPLRRIAKERDASVNDLFMALLAGALGRYLRRGGVSLADAQNVRVSIPVNLRSGRGRELGNQFGLVLLDLPVGIEDFERRLGAVTARMTYLKASLEARVTLLGLSAAGHLPVPVEKRIVRLIGAKSVAVVSNLPGPKRHVRIAGARMRSLTFWPPQAGGIGLGVSFFSYAGTLSIGISADRNVVPNPQCLLDALCEEVNQLRLESRHGTQNAGGGGLAVVAGAASAALSATKA